MWHMLEKLSFSLVRCFCIDIVSAYKLTLKVLRSSDVRADCHSAELILIVKSHVKLQGKKKKFVYVCKVQFLSKSFVSK